MMRRWLRQWLLPTLVVVNVGGIVFNGFNASRNHDLSLMLAERQAQMLRPDHPCGPVIEPGESCEQTFVFTLPDSREPSY
jgi:hypothetical protein